MMNSILVTRGVALAAVLIAAAETRAAPGTVALDNTAGGTATLYNGLASISGSTWWFKVFEVGASNATISSMKMAMWSSSQTTYNTTWELYAVDGSNNPTGAVLASDTQSQSLPGGGGGSASYYDFTIGGTLASYSMQAGQTYGLLFKTDTYVSWTRTEPEVAYTTGSSGFTYIGGRRTFDSGNNWSSTTYFNAWSMTVNASAVPGTGVAGLAAMGLAGLARRRRR